MTDTLTFSGEIITARGWNKWPWADVRYGGRLIVSRDRLCLQASVLGKLTFTPDQVISIIQHGKIPFLTWGIRIHHTAESYPRRIIFRCLRNPQKLIDRIHGIGFIERGKEIDYCLQCGKVLAQNKTYCAYCGWSFGNTESEDT